jgi:hypothetical protein
MPASVAHKGGTEGTGYRPFIPILLAKVVVTNRVA